MKTNLNKPRRAGNAFTGVAFLFGSLLTAQNVNQFTGAFSYNQPLLIVPSNRGVPVGIDASYAAGIQMNQGASEIGLGWNLHAGGAIYRSVSGMPDDTKTFTSTALPDGQTITNGYGALYPQAGSGIYDYDLTTTRRGLDTAEFTFPDYDQYSVAGPGYTGSLKLSYLKFYGYDYSNISGSEKLQPDASLVPSSYYRRPQFHFAGDFSDTLTSRHYSTTLNGGTPFRAPTDVLSGPGFASTDEPYIGKHQNGGSVTNQNFDVSAGRLATSNLVEYFTNSEINTAAGMSFSGAGALDDFMDYTVTHGRSAPADGIGAFRITASNGLTYHYSLPVYETENTNFYFPMNQDYSLVSGIAVTDIPDGIGSAYDGFGHPLNQNVNVKSRTHNQTAVKWLLTAITGADFVDANNNNRVDDDDEGYWVSYDYELWSGSFVQRSPHYGYRPSFNPHLKSQSYPVFFPATSTGSDSYKLSGLYGAVNLTKTEVYHLSRIRTSSHTAIFIREIRADEKGADPAVDASANLMPDLLLKRIILFKNEQLDSVILAHPTTTFNPATYPAFDFSMINNTGKFFSEAWYQTQYNNFYFCILKHVLFDQDYSLCKNYQGNVHVNWSTSTALHSPADVAANLSNANYNASGKLTLNRIVTYGFQNGKVIPSILFDYEASGALSNPDFNPIKADYWGYYKSDATQNGYSSYANLLSSANTKAWSLLKITDPLGGITEMEYESNSYTKVIDNEVPGGVRGAAYIYRIQTANDFYSSCDLTMEEGSNSSNSLTEFLSFNPAAIPGMTAAVCIPFFEAVCNSPWPPDLTPDPIGNPIYSGFIYGNCTFSVNAGTGGSSDHVTCTLTPATSSILSAYNWGLSRKQNPYPSVPPFATQNNYNCANPRLLSYSGNGFLMVQMPIGYTAYGNGIRVKKLKSRNRFSSSNETYVTEYTYENGVVTSEMDRFNFQVLKAGCDGSPLRYDFLQPKTIGRFEMGPSLGYTKVTVKDLGRINTANGRAETTFITDPNEEAGIFSENFDIQTEARTGTVTDAFGAHDAFYFMNECINKFSSIFGSPKESKMYDRNNNMLSKTVYEYIPTEQGALVENFYFRNTLYGAAYPTTIYSNAYSYTVNILRDYPVVVKSTTSYGIGNSATRQESLLRDEITGESTAIRSTGSNESSSISFKTPAYAYYQANDNIGFTSRAFRTILPLGNDMYTYANVDSALTPTQVNGMSASFLKAGYKLYSRRIRQQQYNSSTGLFATATATLPYYAPNRAFVFDAGPGSNDAYGLLAKASLYSNPLSISSMTNILFWEPGGTTYNWKMIYEHTLLDQYKNPVEVRDANNRFTASRYGYNGYHKSASVTNCNYSSFTFADFETPPASIAASGYATIDGDMIVKAGNTFMKNTDIVNGSPLLPHSGSKSILVAADPVTFTVASATSPFGTVEAGLQSGRIYRASVWTHTTNLSNARLVITINGTTNSGSPSYIVTAVNNTYTAASATHLVATMGNWHLLQIDFEVPDKFETGIGGQFSIQLTSANSGTVYFDDFVFRPVESSFSASVYNPRNGRVSSIIDGNGLATNFVYDAMGRTLEVWKEIPGSGYKRLKNHTYNYARGANN